MKIWKKTAALLGVIVLLFTLNACGGSQQKPAAETAAEETAVEETADKEGADTEPAEDEDPGVSVPPEEAAAASTEAAETAAEDVTAAEAAQAVSMDLPDYSNQDNWAYFAIGEEKDADLFLICPTVDMKDEYNMAMDDEKTKRSFTGALNMERGIYEDSTRMYAPFYRQGAMKIYDLEPEEREPYLEFAYKDISAAFSWYLENENNGRPIVLAGFSQGADLCCRLLEEYFGDSDLYDQLVAVYAIGWPVTEDMVNEFPQIRPASSADDTGVVICLDCESPELEESFINPAGQKTFSINPLNWKTDSTPADKTENKGACFTDYSANIKQEVPELCGCYIDEERGTIKVTDVTPEEYPPVLPILPEGSYHLYDYQFFFRNLQQNVSDRVNAFVESH